MAEDNNGMVMATESVPTDSASNADIGTGSNDAGHAGSQTSQPWEQPSYQQHQQQHQPDVSNHQAYVPDHQSYAEAVRWGEWLGYGRGEVEQAFRENPAATMAGLRQLVLEAQSQSQSQSPTAEDVARWLDQQLQQRLQPFEKEREQRLEREASQRFDGELARHFKSDFPAGLADSNKQAITGLAYQILKDSPQGWNGDVRAVEGAFRQAKSALDGLNADWEKFEQAPMPEGVQESASDEDGADLQFPYPPLNDLFWQVPPEAQVDRVLDWQAGQHWDRALSRYIREEHGGKAVLFPESHREALDQLGWSLMLQQPEAFEALRSGDTRVAEHYVSAAAEYIRTLREDGQGYKPADKRTPADMARQLSDRRDGPRRIEPRARERVDTRTLDQIIADLGNPNVSDAKAYGRLHSGPARTEEPVKDWNEFYRDVNGKSDRAWGLRKGPKLTLRLAK